MLIMKEGGNFLNLLQEGVVPSEKGGSNPGGNYESLLLMFVYTN